MSSLASRVVAKICSNRLCAVAGVNLLQSSGITMAVGQKPKTYKAFDYRKKLFTPLHQPFDRSHKKLDENSKVIIIDGPMASGKHEFARRLAKQLDFKYVPQADVNAIHKVGDTGLMYYDLDEVLPESARIYTQKVFLNDKKARLSDGGGRAGWLQVEWFTARLFTYNDALLHLFSTGQGVVCVRSPWSDCVFAKALYDNDYMSKNGYKYYMEEIYKNHVCDYPRPHLTIYLDADVETTQNNVRKRSTEENNSGIFSDAFHRSVEMEYKDKVLPGLESHGELLVYPAIPDITDHEVELMVEDIEALGDLKHSGFADDHRLEDWSYMKDEELAFKRRDYQNLRLAGSIFHHPRPWDAPEMLQDEYFAKTRGAVYNYTPGYRYETGADPDIDSPWSIMMSFGKEKTLSGDRRIFFIPPYERFVESKLIPLKDGSQSSRHSFALDLRMCRLQRLDYDFTWGESSEYAPTVAKVIDQPSRIRHLDVSLNDLAQINAQSVQPFTALVNLNASVNNISQISGFHNLTSLTHLNLSHNKITDISFLQGLTSVQEVNLSMNEIQAISEMPSLFTLHTIHLNDNKLTSINGIQALPHLREVLVQRNFIDDIMPLSTSKHLVSVNASHNKIHSLRHVSQALQSLYTLQSLLLMGNPVEKERLYQADIRRFTSVTTLDNVNLRQSNQENTAADAGSITNFRDVAEQAFWSQIAIKRHQMEENVRFLQERILQHQQEFKDYEEQLRADLNSTLMHLENVTEKASLRNYYLPATNQFEYLGLKGDDKSADVGTQDDFKGVKDTDEILRLASKKLAKH